jgi:ubiquinol-cytochrome c reductase cytochrome b subunit
MRDVRGGWFLRYLHANGASMFFLVVYLHISRGLYYNSFAGRREFVWYSGIIILFLMIITAFLGYVLPWGQMSFWAATVITSLASAIPLVGDFVVAWLWGGFSVGEQTLVRFFSLHYLLPFVLFALVAAHIVLLHETGSNTPTGLGLNWGDRITFGPYFFLKDLYYLVLFFILFMYFVFFNSNYLGHPDNYIPAMYMSTPAHIVPEWYFLPFYALLRSVPNKLGGVIVMLVSIVALAILPVLLNTSSKKFILNSNFMYQRAIFFSFFIANAILLGWIGGQPIEEPMYTVGQYSSIFYFFLIFIVFPILNLFLAVQLRQKWHFVWWQDLGFLASELLRPWLYIFVIVGEFISSF